MKERELYRKRRQKTRAIRLREQARSFPLLHKAIAYYQLMFIRMLNTGKLTLI